MRGARFRSGAVRAAAPVHVRADRAGARDRRMGLQLGAGHALPRADVELTQPRVDLSEEMTHMLVSQRLYQANLAMIQQARDTYSSALTIGKGR